VQVLRRNPLPNPPSARNRGRRGLRHGPSSGTINGHGRHKQPRRNRMQTRFCGIRFASGEVTRADIVGKLRPTNDLAVLRIEVPRAAAARGGPGVSSDLKVANFAFCDSGKPFRLDQSMSTAFYQPRLKPGLPTAAEEKSPSCDRRPVQRNQSRQFWRAHCSNSAGRLNRRDEGDFYPIGPLMPGSALPSRSTSSTAWFPD